MPTALKLAIVKKDITQSELADKCGISQTTLSAIVRGKQEPTLKTARKIAKVLGMSIEELWPDEE